MMCIWPHICTSSNRKMNVHRSNLSLVQRSAAVKLMDLETNSNVPTATLKKRTRSEINTWVRVWCGGVQHQHAVGHEDDLCWTVQMPSRYVVLGRVVVRYHLGATTSQEVLLCCVRTSRDAAAINSIREGSSASGGYDTSRYVLCNMR